MAKRHRMNKGARKGEDRGGRVVDYPEGVHTIDSYGNIFASFPEISRCVPRYFTIEELKEAVLSEKLTSITGQDLENLEKAIENKE